MNIGVACLGRLHNVTAAFLQHESVRRAAPSTVRDGRSNERTFANMFVNSRVREH